MRKNVYRFLTLSGFLLMTGLFQNCAPKKFTALPGDTAPVGTVNQASVSSATPPSQQTPPAQNIPVKQPVIVTMQPIQNPTVRTPQTVSQPAVLQTTVIQPVVSLPVVTIPVASQCTNGATNFPACTVCRAGMHLEGSICVDNTRVCQNQPANSTGGYQTYSAGGWGACAGYSCGPNYFLENGTCVKGCDAQGKSWGLLHLGGVEKRCDGWVPRLRDGESTIVNSTNGNPGFIKASCVNSQYRFASEPSYASHTDNDWQRYMLKVFRNEPLDIACHNELILFQQPRMWESCDTASTAICYAALGSTPTATNICHPTKVLMDDLGIYRSTQIEGRYLGQHFGTQYRIYIKTSKDNFAASYDITADIRAGYGQAMDSANPTEIYSGRPAGFLFVARNDMAGHQIKIFVEGKTYLNGIQRQTYTGETLINVREDSTCANNYDGTGVGNIVIGDSLGSEPNTQVRRGYPWPLHQ